MGRGGARQKQKAKFGPQVDFPKCQKQYEVLGPKYGAAQPRIGHYTYKVESLD